MLKTKLAALTVASAAALAIAPSAHAATDYFMRLDPGTGDQQIQGESQDVTYPGKQGYIPIKSFSWGAENATTIGSVSGGAGAGKAKLDQLTVEKAVDSTTPQVFQRLAQGRHFAAVEIIARRAGGSPAATPTPNRYYFSLAYPVSQEQSGDAGDDAPQEKLTFAYGAVAQKVVRLNQAGVPAGPPALAQWNQALNAFNIDNLPAEMTR